MANRLADESSPYLLQHKDNPVDWRPWGPEALARAKEEDKPIFLSIGYAACHWCHVMEHESFEDDQIAAKLNESFVCIKVDREERPDLDQIYMNAVQLLTGHGGWPMSVFLTPELKPFYAGTYFPPRAGRGMPGFDQVVDAVAAAWREKRQTVLDQSAELTEHLQQAGRQDASGPLSIQLLRNAAAHLERIFDFTHGGFGQRPKFPHAMDLQLLLRIWRRWPRQGLVDMVRLNLDKMARGGIYDHLAGGFARYSVDERWLVPHFEKMLYDNALLTNSYLDAYLATGDASYARIVRETIGYVLAYMTDEQGAFHSTEDADSEGEEGKFYVWTSAEVKSILGEEKGDRFCYIYDVTEQGNFEGHNILNLPKSVLQCAALRGWDLAELEAELADSRAKLLAVRDRRVRPGKDDKVLTNWNALMIDALARAGAALGESAYLAAAGRAAEFLFREMAKDGRLLHSWRRGKARLNAYLDDYSFLASALVSLYEATFDERWIDRAAGLADQMLAHFADPAGGGFFYTSDDHETLIARQKDLQDSSTPSGNSMAATALARLGALCGRTDYLDAARAAAESAAAFMQQAPSAMGQMLIAVDYLLGPLPEVVILGDPRQGDTAAVLADLRRRYVPRSVLACRASADSKGAAALEAIFAGKTAEGAGPTVYVCRNFACQAPVSGKQAAIETWDNLEKMNGDGA